MFKLPLHIAEAEPEPVDRQLAQRVEKLMKTADKLGAEVKEARAEVRVWLSLLQWLLA